MAASVTLKKKIKNKDLTAKQSSKLSKIFSF